MRTMRKYVAYPHQFWKKKMAQSARELIVFNLYFELRVLLKATRIYIKRQ